MRVAFYYHIPIDYVNGELSVPSYLGVFLNALAKQVDELILVMHQANDRQAKECDYILSTANIRWINLGLKTPAWHRAIFYKKILAKKLEEIRGCDAFIVRSPTPLAPYFHKYLDPATTLFFMIVGDYSEGAVNLKKRSLRHYAIYAFLHYNTWLFKKQIRDTKIVVNSQALYDKYSAIAKGVQLISTTTLSKRDFFYREDTCGNSIIELLFTGRIDPAKGLFELLEATAILRKDGINVRCNIVGWEAYVTKPVENELKKKAHNLSISEWIVFHGRKTVGPELNTMYRMADVYIIPSYHEGFPRTIWEAMANSLPVIATNVGAIPFTLHHLQNAIIIDPKNVNQIVKAVKQLIEQPLLRKAIIKNGRKLAQPITLEHQSKLLLNYIKEN